MARNLISSLFVKLTANTTEFQTGMKRAEKRLTATQKQFAKATKAASGFAKGLGLVVSTGAIIQLSRSVINLGSRLDDVSQKLQVSTDFLQTLGFAARETGVRTEAAEMGLQRFVRRVGEAQQGTGELYKSLRQLNIQLRNADGSARDIDSIFRDYADAIQGAETQQERLRLAFKAFDSEGAALVTMLSKGSDGLKEWEDQARSLGQLMDQETIKRLARAENALERINTAAVIFAGEGAIAAIDAFRELNEAITPFYEKAIGLANPSTWDWFKDLNREFAKNAKQLDDALTRQVLGPAGAAIFPESYASPESKGGPAPVVDFVPGGESGGADDVLEKSQKAAQVASVAVLRFNESMSQVLGTSTALSLETTNLTEGLKDVAFDGFENVKTVIEESTEAMRTWQDDAADGVRSFAIAVEDGLLNATREGKAAFGDMAKFILAEIQRIFIVSQLIRPLFGAIGGGLTGMGLGTLGSAFSDYAGGRASGGPVSGGKTYLVGERGPELLTMGGAGRVTPNHAIGGGPTFNVDMRGADVAAVSRLERLVAQVNGTLEQRAVAAVGQTYSRNPQYLR
jgi:hypothetical protein